MVHFELLESAHRGYLQSFRTVFRNDSDPHVVYQKTKRKIKEILNTSLVLRIRLLVCMNILFVKNGGEINEVKQNFYFCSKCERILSFYQIDEIISNCFRKIFDSIEQFMKNGSGWIIQKIEYLDIHIGNYREIRGGCRSISLPSTLKNKKCLINIQCEDNLCFLYSIAAKLFPQKSNVHRRRHYEKYIKSFKTSGMSFPMLVKNIPKFEELNKISINVFGYEGNVYPVYISKKQNLFLQTVDLLLFENHFFLIKNFKRLISSKTNRGHFCKSCLNGFSRLSTLKRHEILCYKNKPQKTSVPSDLILKFKNLSKMLYHPFCIFADFECITEKIHTALPSSSKSFTTALENHRPISYTIIVSDYDDKIIFHEFYTGLDAIISFLITLKKICKKLIPKLKQIMPMNENISHKVNENQCHICKKDFLPSDIRVKDHSHFGEGFFRGYAHNICNLNYRTTYFLPVIIHNFKNYDSHLILKQLPQHYAKHVEIIPTTIEKFSMFTLDEIRFLDSFQFLDASLEKLVENLNNSNHDFKIFNSFFGKYKDKHLLRKKGVFPYSYFDSEEVLKETSLPPKEAFFNVLTNSSISDEDYQHALCVFKNFDCKTFADYLELYQNTDVILLAEVFLSFRRTSLKYYNLDPVHFITGAELTWNAGLKFSKIELELFSDVNDYLWIESQMRGGISFLGERYVVANNPELPNTYNSNIPHMYITALDVNNLYGYVMSMALPIGNFHWLSENEINDFKILETLPDSSIGYFLEVDLEYPQKLFSKHNDFPLAVEHLMIDYEMLSPSMKKLCDNFNLKSILPCKKLVPNFFPKKNYITHYLNLKFYVEEGLIIKKIHRILAFSQKPFLKDYIEFNNNKRNASKNDFEKSFFKKMNNAFFGKTCQNPRKKINVRASLNSKDCAKFLSNPLLEEFQIINENFSLFKLRQANLVLNKPIYVGFAVLELSKLRMYELYYKYFKTYYGSNINLIYIDTDSLYLKIQTDNLYKDFKNTFFKNILDLSNFPKHHFLHDETNKGKLGCLKSETISPIYQFVGLKPKMYAYKYDDICKKTAKGIKKSTLRDLTFDAYKNTLMNQTFSYHEQCNIISKKHDLKTIIQNKVSLSAYYDKKFVHENGISTSSYGFNT